MRNLKVTCCTVLPAEALIARAHCFCLDCDRGIVWVAARNELVCVEDGKVSLQITATVASFSSLGVQCGNTDQSHDIQR